MAGKALIPLAAGGLAIYLLADSAPKKKKKKKNGNGNGSGADPLIVDSGKIGDWSWLVRRSPPQEGFGTLYYGFVNEPEDDPDNWKAVHQEGVAEAKSARALALEFIAQHVEG